MKKPNKFLVLSLIVSASILLTGCPPPYEYLVIYYTRVKDTSIQNEKISFGMSVSMPYYENHRKRVYILGVVANNDVTKRNVFTFSDVSLISINDTYTLLRVDSIIDKYHYASNLLLNPAQTKPVVFIFEGSKVLTKKAFQQGLKNDTLTVAVKGTTDIAKMYAIGYGVK
jgi:hypothetical protein